MTANHSTFGCLLARYLNNLDISAAELAAASGLSRAAISRYLQDARLPSG